MFSQKQTISRPLEFIIEQTKYNMNNNESNYFHFKVNNPLAETKKKLLQCASMQGKEYRRQVPISGSDDANKKDP